MPSLPFTKGHGTGNDFIVFADPEDAFDLSADQVAALCDRRFGIGADGILRAVPAGPEAQAAGAAWFMDYRNADGGRAEMCGNGARVFARYLLEAGLVAGDTVAIDTRAGIRRVRRVDGGFEVDLGAFRVGDAEPLVGAGGLAVARPGLPVDIGNPHVVVALSSEEELEGLDLGRAPVVDPAPRSGTNVEFVVPLDPLVRAGVGALRMRVFERGVGETLSCGTGVAAAAVAVRAWAGPAAPDRWTVAVPGGVLGVRVVDAADGPHALLTGPATLVFSGQATLT